MSELRFSFPRDTVILTNAAGKVKDGKLGIICKVNALPSRNLTINGIPLIFDEIANYYTVKSEVWLDAGVNTLNLRDCDTGELVSIEVRYMPSASGKYRFSLDDNIWFLQNLAKNQHVYSSMFEDPYLNMLRYMHEKYGTKFHLNIYYECPEFGGFNITQMPDKYKDEWKANSDWLRLSPHANANLPDRPYINANYNKTYFEFNRINEQILRFAGEDSLSKKVMTIHWGEATDDAIRAAHDTGVRAMLSAFDCSSLSNTGIAYNLTAEQCDLGKRYGFIYDKKFDMIYFLYNQGNIQHAPIPDIKPNMTAFAKYNPLLDFVEMVVHEQYFYPHYHNYYPDYYERIESAISWCHENGYKPSFVREAFAL